MKQSIQLLRIFLFTSLALTGCQQEVITELSDSGLLISLSDNQLEVTRSTPAELGKPVAGQFNVKIEKKDGQVIYDDKFTEEPIPASAGKYTLTATCGENPVLAWDAPYYKGTATAEVGKGLAKVTIPCAVANALLSINFVNREVFDGVYSAYGVKVENGNQTLLITADLSTQSAYFQAGSTPKVTFEGTLKDGEQAVSLDLTENLQAHLPLQAGDHAKITLRASNTTLKVEKVEVVKETIQETIPSDWLPKPKVNGFADGATTLHYVETNDAVPAAIEFTAPTPIQDAEFTLNLEDEHLTQLNGTYQLSTLSQEQRTLLINSGITLPALQTQKGALDLTQLTTNLQTNAGVTTRNKVSLRIKSNDRWSAEQGAATEYTIETVKPEFTVSVQPGNIWTREFTVDEIKVTSGNAAKIKKQLVYQYSANNGTSWETFNQDRMHQFTECPDEKNYKIRALYRNEIHSSNTIDAALESPVQLPNSNMDNWSHETYGGDYYSFMPYNAHVSATWDTNNLYTTRHRHNANWTRANYNGFHAVSYIPGRGNSGYAAELRSTANGRGNTAGWPRDYNKVAGELYTGTAKITIGSWDNNGANDIFERIKDVEHTSRPTGIRFFYQYIPYKNDTWNIHMELMDESKNIIVEKDFQSSENKSDWTEANIQLEYTSDKLQTKCKYIYIQFSSTITPGANMPYRKIEQTFYVDNATHKFTPAYVGSVLRIDDISLIYDK